MIVNCSAYNAVDAAETNPDAAYALNALGPTFLAEAARLSGALLVHFSTDFVFDGRTGAPYHEESLTNPLSVYGASKLAGEEAARRAPRHFVLPLASVFGRTPRLGHCATIDYVAERLLAGSSVRALIDRTVSPSYAPDVARATRRLIERDAASGTYHCVNSGSTTWYDLAGFVARTLGVASRVEPVHTADLPTIAPRPQFCALSNEKLTSAGVGMPHWRNAVCRHLANRVAGVRQRRHQHLAIPAMIIR